MRKIFDIYINDKPYPVYDIENKHHNLGRYNDSPTTWWLLFDNDHAEPKLINEMEENSKLIPYLDRGVHRICWEINYKQTNYVKYKWDDYDLRASGECILKANGREVYKFRTSDIMYAMSNVQVLIGKIISHSYNFLEPEKDDGRKIFFCGLPAFVYKGYEVGEIRIKPDYSKLNKKSWWKKYNFYNSHHETYAELPDDESEEDYEVFMSESLDYQDNDEINWGDALQDGKIWWFRK